ncbi:MAG TPA: hypothetical protein VN947_07215 [Polyangia bacterium]|nr:hypothetical protein [Polyangia bacterium]
MKKIVLAACILLGATASAKPVPEDYLKGKIIISDRSFPMSWTSVSSYVSTLKGMNKGTLWYDKKTGKLTLQYAAFFAQPVNDVQVMLFLTDITNGAHVQKVSTEQFMEKGKRVLFNSVVFDKEDIEGNKKYLLTLENRRHIIASGTFILREEGPHYSGKVTFTDDDTKANSDSH